MAQSTSAFGNLSQNSIAQSGGEINPEAQDDVINLMPTSIQGKAKKSDTAKAVDPSPGTDRNTASGFGDSISQRTGEINTQSSRQGGEEVRLELERIARQNRRLREARQEAVAQQKQRVARRDVRIAELKEKHRADNKKRGESRTTAARELQAQYAKSQPGTAPP